MLTKLRIALNAAREMCREAEIIDSKEASANRLISQASEYGLESALAQRRIADARMILDLCNSRRRFLKRALPESLGALFGEYKVCIQAWSELVLPQIEGIRQEVLAALRPFYDGQKRHLENDFAALRVPAVFRAEEALFGPVERNILKGHDESLLAEVQNFIQHVSKHSRRLSINIDITP